MTKKPPHAGERIVAYFESMPTVVRIEVLPFVVIYAFDFQTVEDSEADFIAVLRGELSPVSGKPRFAAILRVISATDYVLDRWFYTMQRNEPRLPAILANLPLSDAARRAIQEQMVGKELRFRHAEIAIRDWKCLRDNELSLQALFDLESRFTVNSAANTRFNSLQ